MVISLPAGFPLLGAALSLLAGGPVLAELKARCSGSQDLPTSRALSGVLRRLQDLR